MTKKNTNPILMSDALVLATIAGKKTQTRRVVTNSFALNWLKDGGGTPGEREFVALPGNYCSPYGYAGDVLLVREAWRTEELATTNVDGIRYRAGDAFVSIDPTRESADLWFDLHKRKSNTNPLNWKPSIFMPLWACRLRLEVTELRVERLQEITAEDAQAEGIGETTYWKPKEVDENPKPTHEWQEPYWDDYYFWQHYPQRAFRTLWDVINAKRGFGWDVNPFVFVVSYKVLDVRTDVLRPVEVEAT